MACCRFVLWFTNITLIKIIIILLERVHNTANAWGSNTKGGNTTEKENYDSAFFKLITEKTLNEIEFPIIKLDFTDKQNEITSKFTGEITSGSQKTILQQVLSQTISKIFDEVIILVEKEVKSFKINLDKITEKLMFELLKNIQSEFDEICCKFEDKEKQIDKTQKYILILEKELKK